MKCYNLIGSYVFLHQSWIWLLVPAIIYFIERIARLVSGLQRVIISKVSMFYLLISNLVHFLQVHLSLCLQECAYLLFLKPHTEEVALFLL